MLKFPIDTIRQVIEQTLEKKEIEKKTVEKITEKKVVEKQELEPTKKIQEQVFNKIEEPGIKTAAPNCSLNLSEA